MGDGSNRSDNYFMEGFLSCSVIEYRCIKEGRRGPREQMLRFWWLSIAEPTSCHSTVLANTSVIITGTVTIVWMWKLRLRKVRQLMCYYTAQTSELNTVASNCTDLQRSPGKSIIAPTEHKPPNTSVFLKVLPSRSHYVGFTSLTHKYCCAKRSHWEWGGEPWD